MRTASNSLRNTLILLIAGSTGFLLAAAVAFMYFSGLSHAYERATERLEADASTFEAAFLHAIEQSAIELAAVRISALALTGESAHRDSVIAGLVTEVMRASPSRYAHVTLYGGNPPQVRRISLARAFDGRLYSRIEKLSGNEDTARVRGLPAAPHGFPPPASECSVGFQRAAIVLGFRRSEMGPPIAASLRVAGLAEEVFARTAGSIAALPLIADPRGEVLYSANPQEHGQLLTVVLPEAGAIQASGPEPAAIRAGRWMLSRRQIFDGNITVIMRLDTAGEVREINAMAAHALLLAAGLFTLIMAVIVWLVSRFARALREVTAVAEHVAAGDFSRTIEHQRTDELGALIGAFNEMVRRLRESYAGLHRANRDLESKVDELLRTRSALLRSQKLAVIGETVSTISHEIQNKIGGVSIWAQNLSMHAGSDPTTRLYVQEIQKALSAFLEMLVNFKRYYRQPQLVPTSVDILSLLRQLVHRLNAGAATTTIALHEERAPALPLLSGDADRLDEAVGNLLINALQHSPPGGGVDVFLSGDACGVNITVADRGPGIPDSVQERLFQPFVTTRPDGSGLGLAIAHTIITAHEGTLMYAARPGGGSQFDIRLPVTTSTHPSPCP